MTPPNVVYVVPDVMGGMVNIIAGLLAHRSGALSHHAVLTHNTLSSDTRFAQPLAADTQTVFDYTLPVENLHSVLRRLRRRLPPGEGVLVANDLLELAMLHRHDAGRAVVQILHGDWDYYYDLAETHQTVIDAFVTYSQAMHATLRARLPHRADDIHYLPYGIDLPVMTRTTADGALRVLFAGRFTATKGVQHLPAIDRALRDLGVACAWTMIGDGPDRDALRASWTGSIEWRPALTQAEVSAAMQQCDVFILPTSAEGFPVALVEAMAAGAVPVVSDIRSGVPEIVEQGGNGFRPAVGDVAGFAAAIATLDRDRARLARMSRAARATVEARFDARACTRRYESLFARWHELRRPRAAARLPYGSRLDQPWLPNRVVRTFRAGVRRARGQAV
jgi:glycosyltransferase involved in cell wall biosynthesis